ncbi:serine/threonine-protein phosphatase 6 regulatory ankyrin repeat subunit A [Microdochium nivale]|nr:serine/threonine-protein phosphatase 6 regulatory ankyrin repeat subunit A [Microdochium nivale]
MAVTSCDNAVSSDSPGYAAWKQRVGYRDGLVQPAQEDDIVHPSLENPTTRSVIDIIAQTIRGLGSNIPDAKENASLVEGLVEALHKLTPDNDPALTDSETAETAPVEPADTTRTGDIIDVKGPNGWTAFHHACSDGKLAMVEMLLAARPDKVALIMTTVTDGGWTAVHLAADNGHDNVLQALIKAGADIGAPIESSSWTALICACTEGHAHAIRVLLEADMETAFAQTEEGWTGLHFACKYGHLEAVRALLEMTARPVVMAQSPVETVLDAFDDFEYISRTSLDDGAAASTILSANTSWQIVEKGAACGKLANMLTTDGWTALQLAVHYDHTDIAQLLLEAVQPRDTETTTALPPRARRSATAVHDDDAPAVRAVLDADCAGLLVDVCGRNDWTALHFAASKGRVDAVQLLLAGGADIDARTNCDYTPMYLACKKGHLATVQILLDAGADVSLVDRRLTSPLGIAMKRQQQEVVQLLLEIAAARGGEGEAGLDTSAKGSPEVVCAGTKMDVL